MDTLDTLKTIVLAGSLALLAACAPRAEKADRPAAQAGTTYQQQVARGRQLVLAMDCNTCHTPFKPGPRGPEPDMERMLSGHPATLQLGPPPPLTGGWIAATNMSAWAGPWGISYSANLTPDEETGLGAWSEAQFVAMFHNGKHMGEPNGRPVLPPMPWSAYAAVGDEDLKAIYAYLRTIPAVKNRVPSPAPPQSAALR